MFVDYFSGTHLWFTLTTVNIVSVQLHYLHGLYFIVHYNICILLIKPYQIRRREFI